MKKIIYVICALLVCVAALYLIAVPSVSYLKKTNPKKTALMEIREAQWAAKGGHRRVWQVWTPLAAISPYLVKAVVISEDDKFYEHDGFDFDAMKAAVEKDIKAGRFKAGGSTISQQLAKNLFLAPDKSALRKLREAVITWRLEQTLTKKRIIEIYLNVAEWGDGVFGAEAASRHYFGKSASELTPMEACRLAVVLPSPRRMNPAGDSDYVTRRAEFIYAIMLRRGIVEPEYEDTAVSPDDAAVDQVDAPVAPSVPAADGATDAPAPPLSGDGQGQRPL
ncbi:MAG: monofunctional biosynthetic peptidoglycan transglycosylase [Deltaproteobacteria bacterium]|nr:monofunctional biosynthetic peptidoglycan transglycosylase [Deltaproteobacteria bacterium]